MHYVVHEVRQDPQCRQMSLSWSKAETGPHISSPTPHSVSLCIVVPFLPHSVQSSVSTNRILCSKSWITIYNADMASSDVGMLRRLFQLFPNSITGWICVTRTSRGGVAVVAMLLRVPYIRRLKFRSVSSCLLGFKYAHSRAWIRRYS